ncbi:MAG TPA: hypothetical protein VK660_09495 [Xanthomonadaceae bacterium]|jgi:hypothetical protein|nr:hypothetical protein [Xanthomonadaceae bacterium]
MSHYLAIGERREVRGVNIARHIGIHGSWPKTCHSREGGNLSLRASPGAIAAFAGMTSDISAIHHA